MSYRAFWQRRCRAATAGAVLKPSGGNCAVLPLNFQVHPITLPFSFLCFPIPHQRASTARWPFGVFMCRLLGMKPGRKVEEAMQSVLYWKGQIENGCTISKVRNISMDEFSHLKSKLLAEQVEEQIYHYILDTCWTLAVSCPMSLNWGKSSAWDAVPSAKRSSCCPAKALWKCAAAPAPMCWPRRWASATRWG